MIEIPGFEIRRELGKSAHASVYLALQTSLDREVALKVMAATLASDAAFGARFLQEARTLASLAHPNIVPVYDVDAEAGQHYFSMQYLPGGDFAARAAQVMADAELVATLQGIAEALDYVHQRGLVHRDVRPSNILYDESGAPVLTDFGIARAVGASAGNTGTDFSADSGHYMSPEQARGASLDARADLYSLGALTYFGLVGKPPYDGPDGFAVAYAHVFEPIPRLPAARSHWQDLIDRALAKEPAQRFVNAREFIDALAAISAPLAEVPAAPPAATPEPAAQTIQMACASGLSRGSAGTRYAQSRCAESGRAGPRVAAAHGGCAAERGECDCAASHIDADTGAAQGDTSCEQADARLRASVDAGARAVQAEACRHRR